MMHAYARVLPGPLPRGRRDAVRGNDESATRTSSEAVERQKVHRATEGRGDGRLIRAGELRPEPASSVQKGADNASAMWAALGLLTRAINVESIERSRR